MLIIFQGKPHYCSRQFSKHLGDSSHQLKVVFYQHTEADLAHGPAKENIPLLNGRGVSYEPQGGRRPFQWRHYPICSSQQAYAYALALHMISSRAALCYEPELIAHHLRVTHQLWRSPAIKPPPGIQNSSDAGSDEGCCKWAGADGKHTGVRDWSVAIFFSAHWLRTTSSFCSLSVAEGRHGCLHFARLHLLVTSLVYYQGTCPQLQQMKALSK